MSLYTAFWEHRKGARSENGERRGGYVGRGRGECAGAMVCC